MAPPSPIVWDKAVDKVRQLPADVGLRSIVSVELIPAMPLLQRLALRLPRAGGPRRPAPP